MPESISAEPAMAAAMHSNPVLAAVLLLHAALRSELLKKML
jgi:hypothetical protein